MRRQARGYMQAFETDAGADALWRALTAPEALCGWLATEAFVEPREGGRYATVSRLFGRREARIERFEPGVRLSLLYQPDPEWPPLPDGAVTEDFLVDERKGRRMLRVMGSGIPAGEEWDRPYLRLRTGWALAFAQLQLWLKDGRLPEGVAP